MDPATRQQIFVLLLTALVTGLLIPALVKLFDVFVTSRVERDREIRGHQLELLERLTKIVWQWRYSAKQVAYYGIDRDRSTVDRDRYENALRAYDTGVWEQFAEIKAIKAAAVVWFGVPVARRIEALYRYLKDDIDSELTTLTEGSGRVDFSSLSKRFTEQVSSRIEMHIARVAMAVVGARGHGTHGARTSRNGGDAGRKDRRLF